MATGAAGSRPLPTSTATGTSVGPVDRERYIERQLRRTRRQVRGVELASRLMLLAAAAVAFFLVAAVFDHWLVPGGLSIYGRLAFLAAFLLGAGWFAARELAPLFVYRINPLFAAHTIERAKPTLKNSLLNFLMLRSNRALVPEVVLSAVEEQAATNLQRTSIEHVVDRTRLIQIGYLLLAMVAAFCLYYVASPKSPLQTLGRVVLPWADLVAPSRVELSDIQPGTTTVFRGERVTVSAEVRGLSDDEAVTLYFTSADRQSVDRPVRMYVSKDSPARHTVTLPPASSDAAGSTTSDGLQQDIEYYIEAGDAKSREYRLSVIQAPNIVVEKLDYAYPAYTRLGRETVERTGDIKAVEGTQVTVHAVANQPIASAYVDLGGDGRHKQPMKVDGQRATTTITLALDEERTSPAFSHYTIRFVTDLGHENPEPIRYRIEVTPDPAPELQLLRPEKVETPTPLNAPVQFEIEASDSLYGLADVKIIATVGGETAFRRNRTISKHDKSPARLVYKHTERLDRITVDGGKKLKPGDVIEYWAEAVDNKTPKPNVTKTDVRKLVIVEPQRRQDPNQQPQDNQRDGQRDDQQQDGDRQNQDDQRPNQRPDRNEARENERQGQPNQDQDKQGDTNDKRGGSDNKRGGENRDPSDAKDQTQKTGGRDEQKQDQRPGKDAGKPRERDGQKQGGKSGDSNDRNQGGPSGQNKSQKNGGEQKGDPSSQDEHGDADNQGQRGGDRRDNADQQSPAQQQDERPVDKSDEGEAFQRILKHAEEKDGKTPQQADESKDQRPATGDRASKQDKSDDNGTKRDEGKGGTAAEQSGQKGAQKTDAGSKRDDAPKDGQPQPKTKDETDKAAKSGEAQANQGKQEKRESDKAGGATPAPQEKARPKSDQRPTDSADAKQKQDQPEKSPGAGKKDSNTQGEQSGDRRGEGKEGGGQSKNQAGKGASGASDAADEGGNAAKEAGQGDAGRKTGDDKTAKNETGKSGTEKGQGSKSQPGADGGRQGGDRSKADDRKKPEAKRGDSPGPDDKFKSTDQGKTDKPDGNQGKSSDAPPAQPDAKSGEGNGVGKRSATGGGGMPPDGPADLPDAPRQQPTDDQANLDYAKRATDLALDHLRNQLKDGKPDDDLLDRLGWSKEDLQKLLARWEKMEREAKQPGPQTTKAKENLQEALKSLGLRPPTASRKASTKADDAARGLRDAARSAPPPEYADEYRAFQRSTSRGK